MADQPNIFGSEQQPTQAQQTPATPAQAGAPNNTQDFAHLLSSIKNERGEQKYSTLEAALEGLRNAQEYIPNLKAEQAAKDAEIERLRKEAERIATLEEAIAALTSQPPHANTNAPVVDENKIADLVNRTLSQREQKQVADANVATVVSTLQQSFGADADKKFYDKGIELGMTREEMNALAARSPKAVFSMLGINPAAQPRPNNSSPTPGTVNTAAFTPTQQTFIGRNPNQTLVGATTQDIQKASERARLMVEELHAQGKSVHDLTDPKVYARYFNQ